MLLKRLADLNLDDIQSLCANRKLEDRFIDFKEEGIGVGDRDKREFLADVSAFANASVGDVVLGVRTRDGAADEVCGIVLEDVDREKLRLVSILRDGLEPRVTGVDFAWLPIKATRGVLVIRVPRSWSAPHRVTFLKDMNFYLRNAAGKNPMGVDELRQSFNWSRDLAQRLRDFRAARIAAIQAGDLPVALSEGPKLVVHFAPLSAIVDPMDLVFKQGASGLVLPVLAASSSWQHSIEGYTTFTMPGPSRAYSLMFRDGAVEVVAVLPITDHRGYSTFLLQAPEKMILDGWKSFRTFAGAFGVEPPVHVFATLLEIKGRAPHADVFSSYSPTAARKDTLILPEIAVGVDRFADPSPKLFKLLLDRIANAFGLPGSPSYDDDGNFIGQYAH